ncbi:hypothetical protein M3Y98_00465900 [Aphelenchoides besseyi]|nr:hypothetical protein M3Y98_00465900 [Aphelenchoides besseyi]
MLQRNDQRLDAEDARGCTKMRLRRTHTGKWISVVLLSETLDENSLFPSLDCDYSLYHGMLKGIEGLDASCFYGRAFGFRFAPSVTSIFNAIGIILATYSWSWESGTAAFSSLLNSGRYFLNSEERARRIIKVTREADLEFCRDFWNLSEIPPPKLFCPTMEINKVVLIPMDDPIRLDGRDGRPVEIPEPSAHGPSTPIQVRILSATSREGLSSTKSTKPLSSNLLLHCHGEGWKSGKHIKTRAASFRLCSNIVKIAETYLRLWAKYLDCPIVSVDYSLAPQFPFPLPTEDVLYAYAWILKNPEKFGWDGKKLSMVGDSAGGNLIVSVALRLAQLKAARMPDGLIPISSFAIAGTQFHGSASSHEDCYSLCCCVHRLLYKWNYIGTHKQHMSNLAADDNVFERENGQNAAEVNAGRRLFHCTTPVRNCDPRTRTCSTPKLTRAAQKEAEKVKTSLSELLELNLPRDCLISPMYTPDELLRELPTCRFIVSERF